MTARAIAMVATAAFDAWANYDANALGTRLGSRLRRPSAERTTANKEVAVSYAVYRVLVEIYPTEKPRFDAMMGSLGLDPNNLSTDTTSPIGIGNTVASTLITFRRTDGSNQLGGYADTTGYVPVNTPDSVVDPSKWQQLRFANGASPGYIGAHWGLVVPFAVTSPSAIRPPAPPAYGSPTYMDQMEELIDTMSRLDDTKKVISEYWADGPQSVLPPGHWQLFGQFVSQRDRHTIDEDVQMFFLLGNAVHDSAVVCWDCKRFYNSSRPFTAIRANYAGQQVSSFLGAGNGVGLDDGANWYPYQSRNFITPPFPEYTSGHSTFSAAGAEILRRWTGSDRFDNSVTVQPATSVFDPNVPTAPVTLSWDTFSHAADQAGLSRRYGGIHFSAADFEGRRCGRIVGQSVWDLGKSYIEGTAVDRHFD